MFEKRVDALEESRDKKEFVINRRICEELMPAIWVTIDRSGYNFPSEFNEAIRKVEDRFDDISDKLTERFSKGEETETEFDWILCVSSMKMKSNEWKGNETKPWRKNARNFKARSNIFANETKNLPKSLSNTNEELTRSETPTKNKEAREDKPLRAFLLT